MSTASDTSVEISATPTVTCHAYEDGSVFMSEFGSSHFNMVQSPVQQSPMNFYGPYLGYPLYLQGVQHKQAIHSRLLYHVNLTTTSHQYPSLSPLFPITLVFA